MDATALIDGSLMDAELGADVIEVLDHLRGTSRGRLALESYDPRVVQALTLRVRARSVGFGLQSAATCRRNGRRL